MFDKIELQISAFCQKQTFANEDPDYYDQALVLMAVLRAVFFQGAL